MSITVEQCIEVLDKILAGHVLSTVDWEAMREASQLVKEFKERPNNTVEDRCANCGGNKK